MAKFNLGDKVKYINSNESGVIIKVYPPTRGRQTYYVKFGDGEKNCIETRLISDVDLNDPFENLILNVYGDVLDFSKINTLFKLKNTSNNTISSLKASNTIFKAYQFKPLLKFLNSSKRRILIADEVGLGKTIEAGHIMMELWARNELNTGLIICPVSLREKWQNELKIKFGLDFKIYNSKNDFLEDLRINGRNLKGILNYEKIRKSRSNDIDSEQDNSIIGTLERLNKEFDFVLCDEAHRLRNNDNQTYKGAEVILEKAKSVVFLTATPIMISRDNLYNLLHLLDNERYNSLEIFENELAVNVPFVKALRRLNNNIPLSEIAEKLESEEVKIHYYFSSQYNYTYERTNTIDILFKDIPLYSKIIEKLKTEPDTYNTRVKLQFDILELSEFNNIFSRTRKQEVTQDWSQAVREPYPLIVDLHKKEREIYNDIINEYVEDNYEYDRGFELGLIQRKRQVASSVYGYLYNKESGENIKKYLKEPDAKFEALLKIINEIVVRNKKKIIVFALFRNTLEYLKKRLDNISFRTAMIHGGIENRVEEISIFKNKSDVNILLSSEVGSEGLDMQFCDSIVNYDLPWNPMVVEQRIGRIDRFGQKSKKVNIYNLIIKDSIQEEIFGRLLDRIQIFRESIGDLEAIMDKDLDNLGNIGVRNIRDWFNRLERELYSTKLTSQEREDKIEVIEKAIIREKLNLKKVNEGLTDSLTNDVYFKNEVSRIQNNHRYITAIDLKKYIEIFIEEKFPTIRLKEVDKNQMIYELNLPLSNPNILVNFLNEYYPEDRQIQERHEKFISNIRGETSITITTSQETGYENDSILRINPYHPLINSITKHFEENNTMHKTFSLSINSEFVQEKNLPKSNYILALYKIIITKKAYKKDFVFEYLTPILYSLDNDKVIEDDNIAENLLGNAQQFGKLEANIALEEAQINDLRSIFSEQIEVLEGTKLNEEKIKLETHKIMEIQRITEKFEADIERQENTIDNMKTRIETYKQLGIDYENDKKALPAHIGRLNKLIEEKESIINEIKSRIVSCKPAGLLSLTFIKII